MASEDTNRDVVDDGSSTEESYSSSEDVRGGAADEDWEDWEEDSEACLSLFSDDKFPTAKAALAHCKEHNGFDFDALKRELGLDFYRTMRLVNFIRQQVKDHPEIKSWNAPQFQKITVDHPLFSDDQYLKPVLEDDALLFTLGNDDENDDGDANFSDDDAIAAITSSAGSNVQEVTGKYIEAEKRARAAEEKVAQLEGVLREYQAIIKKSLEDRLATAPGASSSIDTDKETTNTTTTTTQPSTTPTTTPPTELSSASATGADDSDFDQYFTSYAHFGIHESMLKDAVRTDSYRDALYLNKHIVKDKVVLDIGCGTSILSMFSAKSGAKKVIGIDRSDIILKAQKIVRSNNLDDVVTLVRGKAEEVVLPVDKVDIIVSEWMGYFLLFESMLDTVIYARDKWLKPDGIVQPSYLHMLLAAGSMEEYYNDHISYWSDVYGFKMDCMREPVLKEAQVDDIHKDEIMSTAHCLKTFDILHMKNEDQEYVSNFELKITKEGPCHSFVGYFDTEFTWNANPLNNKNTDEHIVKFSTGPHATPTHWRQTVFLLDTPIHDLKKDDVIKGSLTCRKDTQYFRALNILIEYWVEKDGVKSSEAKSQHYMLG